MTATKVRKPRGIKQNPKGRKSEEIKGWGRGYITLPDIYEGDIVFSKKFQCEVEVAFVRESSIIGFFVEPNPDYEFENTVIHHDNYILVKRGEVQKKLGVS